MAVGALQAGPSSLQAGPSGKIAFPALRIRPRVLAVTVLVSLVSAVVGVEFLNTQAAAAVGYRGTAVRLQLAINDAEAHGYSTTDLAPTIDGINRDGGLAAPMFFQQAGSYQRREADLGALLARIPQVEAAALARHRAEAEAQLNGVQAGIGTAENQGADPDTVAALRTRLQGLIATLGTAADPRAVAAVTSQATAIARDAAAAGAAAAAEQAQLQQAADALKAQFGGNIDQLRAAGAAAVAATRNDATVAQMLKITGADKTGHRIEHYSTLLTNSGIDQVALGAAGAQSLQKKIHDALTAGMPSRTIVVSLTAQELWAYQDGKVVQDTLVTTGRPELPTDIGAMKVLSKDSPWKMHSPWPKGSPHWYPDTMVQKVVWFTATGEGLHDASWEPLSYYGPGGQNSSVASHGCIHLPNTANDFIFNWAQVGTPVIVYPGDGAPLSDQVAKISVDADGVPLTGPKGS